TQWQPTSPAGLAYSMKSQRAARKKQVCLALQTDLPSIDGGFHLRRQRFVSRLLTHQNQHRLADFIQMVSLVLQLHLAVFKGAGYLFFSAQAQKQRDGVGG